VSVLPSGWTESDIGSPGLPGYADYNPASGTWTIGGSGSDVWNTADEFHFASQNLAADGSIIAQVTAVQNTDPWGKAGVMFHNSADPSVVFADVMATPGNGVTFQWRTAYGTVPNNVNLTGLSAPIWVKLTRVGNSFSAFYSNDGNAWTQLGTAQTVVMNTTALAGLAVTAHNIGLLNNSSFANVSGTALADVIYPHRSRQQYGRRPRLVYPDRLQRQRQRGSQLHRHRPLQLL
jgi:hypothetical protein